MILALLMVAFGLIPLGNILRFDVGTGVALLPLDIVVGFLAVVAIPHHLRAAKLLKKDPVFRWMAGFVVIGFASLILHIGWLSPLTFIVSKLYLVRFIAYAQIIWVVSYLSEAQRTMVLRWLGVVGAVSALLGIGQYLLYPDLRNVYYAGWDEHVYRIFGTFLDPNFTGALYISVLATLSLLHQRKLLYTIHLKPIVAGAAGLIAMTYSRSSYLAFLVFGVLMGLLHKSKRVVGGVAVVFFLTVALISMNRSYESVDLFRTASIQARLVEYEQALEIAADSPLLGVGFNAYRYAQLRHGFLDFEKWDQDHAGAGVPNSWLFVLATTGIIGLITYVGMWFHIMRHLWRRQEWTVFSLFSALFIHACFENTLSYPFLMVIIFFLFGFVRASADERNHLDT